MVKKLTAKYQGKKLKGEFIGHKRDGRRSET